MESKIRIKMGAVEVEFEGSEGFLKKELQELLTAVSHLYKQNGLQTSEEHSPEAATAKNGNGSLSGTTATIAGKLGVKGAPELITAAAAHLTFVADKAEFSRKELLAQMQGASGYYKTSMGKNFTNYLNSRIKSGELVEPRSGYYALSSHKQQELRKALVN